MMQLPAILARRWYVFVLVLGAAMVGLGVSIVRTPSTYDAQVMIQVTAPKVDDVQLLSVGNRSSSILRDDLLLVRNDFDVVVKSSEVRDRTSRQLNLQGADRDYVVNTAQIADSNFVTLTVRSRTPELAQSIANAQATLAIQYFGELRAKPAATTADFLDGQLQAARANVANLQKAPTGATGPNLSDLQDALSNYQLLLQKRSDALLVAQDAARVSYIQIVAPAAAGIKPSYLKAYGPVVGLTVVGGFGLALVLTLVLEGLFSTSPKTLSSNGKVTNGHVGASSSVLERISGASASSTKHD